MKITISVGKSRKEQRWKIKTVEWSRLVEKLSQTIRTAETVATYKTATKDRKSEIKDVGGFVGGAVEGGRRVRGSVRKRSLLTLDLDYAEEGVWDDITMNFGCAMCLYSTHSHTAETPRYRLIIPLDREVDPDEHEAIGRKVAAAIGINMFDDTTYQAERLMYWPSTAKDGEYVFEQQDGDPLRADSILAEYRDWRDISQWPTSSRIDTLVQKQMKRKGEPTERPGVVGAFCRAYTVSEAIDTFLSDIYEPVVGCNDRYTYAAGSSAAGLIVYEDKFAYSHHATDPAGQQMCNAFDLVRIHLYGIMDEDTKEDVPVNKLPSYTEMEHHAHNDEKVKSEFNAQRQQKLQDDFSDLLEDEPEPEPEEQQPTEKKDKKKDDEDAWMNDFDMDSKGNVKSSSRNILLVLENAKGLKGHIRRNDFTGTDEVTGNLPWRKLKFACDYAWNNDDEQRLRVYLEKYYNITGKEKIVACFTEYVTAHSYHPIRTYLSKLTWDGEERAETLLVDYLGAKDTPLTRAVSRKFLAAAVARVFDPGVKFDYVTVLQGAQGIGKSTLLRKLAGDAWFNESVTNLEGKDAMEALQGSWIIELGELQAIKRSEIENTKAFISRQVDSFRPAYGRVRENRPRQCVFFATTNEATFLKGSDGNRRFWVIPCCVNEPTKDVFTLSEADRGQIWAEAVQIYKSDEPLFLNNELETAMRNVQEDYNEDVNDVRVGMIAEFLDKKLPVDWNMLDIPSRYSYLHDEDAIEQRGVHLRDRVCIAEIMAELFNEKIDDRNRFKVKEYVALMKKVRGWEQANGAMRFSVYGVQRGYVRVEN